MPVLTKGKTPKIAIVKLGSIGDCLHTLPLVKALKNYFPDSFLAWIVERKSKDVLIHQEGIDQVIVVDTVEWRRGLKKGRIVWFNREFKRFKKQLSSFSFDFAIDGQGLIKSGLISFLTGAPVRVGFSRQYCREGLNALFTNRGVRPSGDHVVHQTLSLIKGIPGIKWEGNGSLVSESFPFRLSRDAIERVDKWWNETGIGEDGVVIGLHPGAGFPTKQWRLERFIDLSGKLMARDGFKVIFTPGEMIGPLEKRLLSIPIKPYLAYPFTLEEIAALYKRCRVVVAGDTGPLHLASAVGCPTVGLFGPSEAKRSGPLGTDHRVVQQSCPCRGDSSFFPRQCRNDVGCMERIQVEEVYSKVRELALPPPSLPPSRGEGL